MKATKLFTSFFESEKASGIILLVCTTISILLANSNFSADYIHFFHQNIGGISIEHLINDGLMTIFFLMIGLELEREIYIGELSNLKNAMLPILAAIGGMLVPALCYFWITKDAVGKEGIGIPMATDIAFAIGILSLLGNKVPTSLKIFLTALAVIDDLGAILVIAIFYSNDLHWMNLGIAMGIFLVMLVMNRSRVYYLPAYLILGIVMWYFMLHSGVHATITGVLLAFAIPFENGAPKTISYRLEHFLHRPVAFLILPIFALANTAITIQLDANSAFPAYGIAIMVGLILGKPLGISLFSYIAVQLKIASLPEDLQWKSILGAGQLGGIGFTMSIFITLLAFNDTQLINNAKLYIIIASVLSGIFGLVFLKCILKKVVT